MSQTETAAVTPPLPRKAPPKRRRLPQPGDVRYGRSKLKNGSVVIAGVNQGGAYVRRLKELMRDYMVGRSNATPTEQNQIRHACVLEIELEHLETKFAKDGAATKQGLGLYQRTIGNHRRLLQALGLQQRESDGQPKGETYENLNQETLIGSRPSEEPAS